MKKNLELYMIKVGLFSGLREDEIIYIHNTEICDNLGGCNCNKLHVIDKSNGVTIIVIDWFRAHKKCYFTILPIKIWQEFRKVANFNDVDIDVAHQITKKIASIMFVGLRKIHRF